MAHITAVEFGGDTCALARVTLRGGEVAVSAAELLNPSQFPGVGAFTVALLKSRRALGLARRCRVVLWGLPDGASRTHSAVKAVLAPLTGAGFRVERVVSPCNALAALARVKAVRGAGATCWVAINRGGVAIVVIRPGKQIYAHSFPWDSNVGATGSQARLLQRYSLVSFLAPEVKRAMSEARASGFPVEAVITCGNLPDLRSLTMPLIEELDIEVETLDSLDGLVVKPEASERLSDAAASIRLACAGVIARPSRPWDDSKRIAAERAALLARVAAVLALLALLAAAFFGYERWQRSRSQPSTPVRTTATAPPPPPVRPAPSANPPVRVSRAPRTSVQPPVVAPPAQPSNPPAPKSAAPATNPSPAAKPSAPPAVHGEQPVMRPPAPPVPSEAKPTSPARQPAPAPAPPLPPLLRDPLPRVTAILISSDRRLATIGRGQIVGVGDAVGRRVVVAIDERVVVLREPSGVHIRVGLGGRLLGATRDGPPGGATRRDMRDLGKPTDRELFRRQTVENRLWD